MTSVLGHHYFPPPETPSPVKFYKKDKKEMTKKRKNKKGNDQRGQISPPSPTRASS